MHIVQRVMGQIKKALLFVVDHDRRGRGVVAAAADAAALGTVLFVLGQLIVRVEWMVQVVEILLVGSVHE